ncbi:MAG: hypothetical protein KF693_01925 [Nitrospira sp.]|nr:hypothetical protein [Nitrospira sp.]
MDEVTCRRFQSPMHPIDPLVPLDVLHGGKDDRIRAWRCLTCGDLIDPVIIQNRVRSKNKRAIRRGTTPRQPVFRLPDS